MGFDQICRKSSNGSECGGELMFSHTVEGNTRMFVYICKICGQRTEVT